MNQTFFNLIPHSSLRLFKKISGFPAKCNPVPRLTSILQSAKADQEFLKNSRPGSSPGAQSVAYFNSNSFLARVLLSEVRM